MNAAPQTDPAAGRPSGKPILLVDDNPVVLEAFRGALERRGFRVETATDGLDAMKKAMVLKPALVVLDLLMPKVDGLYVLKFIHSQPTLKTIPVIVLSEAALADAGQPALAENPDAVLFKSQCTPSQLANKISELLGSANPAAPASPP